MGPLTTRLSSLTQALIPWVHPGGLPHSLWKRLLSAH